MGIRFDKNSRRATNGPVIFFSDPSAESSIGDEIRGAINAKLSFYTYRRPGDVVVTFGSSDSVIEGLGEPGFVIAPFNPKFSYFTIPYRSSSASHKYYPVSIVSFPENSTIKEMHAHEVEEIKRIIGNSENSKIIASAVIIENSNIDFGKTFGMLCRNHPDAFVFCFGSPVSGVWIGASPELLLESKNDILSSMALAGSRPIGSTGIWDKKNIKEQKIVSDFIADTFRQYKITPDIDDIYTKKAGKIEHLCNIISGIPGKGFDLGKLNSFLHDLSPTPALCGFPRNIALETISSLESFDRGFYGGFCGPFHSIKDFTFNVILRCAMIEEKRYALFIGGGITKDSETENEWEETRLKALTMSGSIINSSDFL